MTVGDLKRSFANGYLSSDYQLRWQARFHRSGVRRQKYALLLVW